MRKLLSLIFIVFFFNACATNRNNIREEVTDKNTGEQTAVVEVEGIVNIINNDIPNAKKRAIVDAQKNAVEMAVGVYVNASTRVEKTVLVEQKILSKTNGYIKKYKILQESREGNFYKTKIQAVVKIEEISRDLTNIGLNAPPPTTLRIAVLIQDKIDGVNNEDGISANTLTEKLLGLQYKIVDITGFNQEIKNLKRNDLINNIEQQKRLGNLVKADIVVVGKASSVFYTDKIPGDMISYNANISLKVIKIKESALIYSNTFSSGGVSITRETAAKESLKRAALLASEDLGNIFQQRLKIFNYITITIRNLTSINQLNSVVKDLQGINEAKNTKMGNFSNGIA
ncbi:MAG: flagellar assembly protein T N-terminal domain-containing protein, partial [Candidatus Omnitrophota bacterium]